MNRWLNGEYHGNVTKYHANMFDSIGNSIPTTATKFLSWKELNTSGLTARIFTSTQKTNKEHMRSSNDALWLIQHSNSIVSLINKTLTHTVELITSPGPLGLEKKTTQIPKTNHSTIQTSILAWLQDFIKILKWALEFASKSMLLMIYEISSFFCG